MTKAIDTAKDGGYIILNKTIMHKFGTNAAILYGEICAEHDYWEDHHQLDDNGWFYSTVENVEKSTSLSKYEQKQALTQLKDYIEVKYDGMPRKRFLRLVVKNFDCKWSKNLTTSGQKILPQVVKKFDLNINNNNINNNINKDNRPAAINTPSRSPNKFYEYFEIDC